jgi:hypothetical protein
MYNLIIAFVTVVAGWRSRRAQPPLHVDPRC